MLQRSRHLDQFLLIHLRQFGSQPLANNRLKKRGIQIALPDIHKVSSERITKFLEINLRQEFALSKGKPQDSSHSEIDTNVKTI